MGRFLLGFVLCAVTIGGALTVWLGAGAVKDPCFGRCSDGTRCMNRMCLPSIAATPSPEPPKNRRHRPKLSNNGIGSAEPEKKLAPGDERSTTVGDALGRPERLDLSKGDEKELDQNEIDRLQNGAEPSLSKCITEAVADWPLESGKIELGYRIEQDGSVKKVRLTAPALLIKNGLYGCMKSKVTSLKFSRSGGASVVTFPFQLQ